ncbi:RNHCP domain-containing protein [Streptomyces sp. NPDC058953]|uniref:RNHCP domain-containing protein n=1 Tax=unclassified Streptomyces TaxID=2593676 RepID=UPI0036875CB8
MPRRVRRTEKPPKDGRGPGGRRGGPRPQAPKGVLHGRSGEHGESFRCAGCRLDVSVDAPGTAHRNHCPQCLASLHLDARIPGDRASRCRGRMTAIGLAVRPDGEWLVIHRCLSCDGVSANRIAGDDNPLPLIRLATRPLADPGVPVRALLTL